MEINKLIQFQLWTCQDIKNKHIANDGFLFDWKEPRFYEDKQEYLYVSVLYLGDNDSIDNYIQVEESDSIEFYK